MNNFMQLVNSLTSLVFLGYTFTVNSTGQFFLRLEIAHYEVIFIIHKWGYLELGFKCKFYEDAIYYKRVQFSEFQAVLSLFKTAWQFNDSKQGTPHPKIAVSVDNSTAEDILIPVIKSYFDILHSKAMLKKNAEKPPEQLHLEAIKRARFEEKLSEEMKARFNS